MYHVRRPQTAATEGLKERINKMKITKTEINHKVGNNTSSWIIYITKTPEDARAIHSFAMTQRAILNDGGHNGWYYSVGSKEVANDCRVPEFFHDRGYHMTAVEHNNGSWDAPQTYTLYIVE